MSLDALVIAGLRRELEGRLLGARLERLFQPYRGDLLFSFRKGNEGYRLYFSADTPLPWVGLVETAPENPASAPSFCMLLRKYLLGSRLLRVDQPGGERRLALAFEGYEEVSGPCSYFLYLEFMGRRGNAVLVDREGRILDALWRKGGEGGRAVEPGTLYFPPAKEGRLEVTDLAAATLMNLLAYAPPETELSALLKQKFLGLAPQTIRFLLLTAGLAPTKKVGELAEEEKERLWQAIARLAACIRQGELQPCLCRGEILAFPLPGQEEEVERIPSLARAIGEIYGAAAARARQEKLRASLLAKVRTHLERALRKREKQRQELATAGEAETLREYGELILAYLAAIPKGAREVTLPSLADPTNEIAVPLDPALSASENAQVYFRRYRRAKRAQTAVAAQLAKTEEEIAYLESLCYAVETAEDETILAEIAEEMAAQGLLPAEKTTPRMKKSASPRRFFSQDGLVILVGRNNRQNEEVTFRLAAPDDLWFHVRGAPGAHVILKCPSRREPPPTSLLDAALLAVYFSRAREGSKVAVDYTRRKHVRKQPHGRPGAVYYERFQTLILDPLPERLAKLLTDEEKETGFPAAKKICKEMEEE
ncbi:MAG: Rqc2 family fibronectin-binding protein [Bacillota bacterium]